MLKMIDGHAKPVAIQAAAKGQTKPAKPARTPPVTNVWESMHLDQQLSPFAVEKRKAAGEMMDRIYKDLIPHVEAATFPVDLLNKNFRELGIGGLWCKDFGSPGLTSLETGACMFEIAKRDVSVSTGYLIHHAIGMDVIDKLGNQE
jgi:alkylation response protein AidB-like acyl-CoA dehydrogenase